MENVDMKTRALIAWLLIVPLALMCMAMIFGPSLSIMAQEIPDFGSIEEIFVWIATGGGATILVGYVMAYILENWPKWHELPRFVKTMFPIVLAALVGILAKGVLVGGLLEYIPPGIQVLILMMINWLFGQLAYRSIKEGEYASSARSP